jgi:hypothetical protein
LAGAPRRRRPGQQDLKALQEIKARRDRTPIGTVIAIEIATGTKTTRQAHRHRARRDNIPSKTPTEDGPASEIKEVV